MNTFEMEGFLRGKCLPGDLLVGESKVAYLVRKLNESSTMKAERDALEQRVNALAVENAGLRYACGGDGDYRDCPGCTHSQYIEAPETPATDAALAAIEARGVEKFIVWATASSGFDYDLTIEDAQKFANELREVK